MHWRKGLERLNATVRGTVAADGLTEANLYLLPLGADANESLPEPFDDKPAAHSVGNNPSVKNQRFLPAPFTQGRLAAAAGRSGTLIFSHGCGRKCKRVPSGVPIKAGVNGSFTPAFAYLLHHCSFFCGKCFPFAAV